MLSRYASTLSIAACAPAGGDETSKITSSPLVPPLSTTILFGSFSILAIFDLIIVSNSSNVKSIGLMPEGTARYNASVCNSTTEPSAYNVLISVGPGSMKNKGPLLAWISSCFPFIICADDNDDITKRAAIAIIASLLPLSKNILLLFLLIFIFPP